MTINVVLTTYNGAQFIVEQLDSIFNQTQKPDRVIIRDDCSADDTFEIVEEYIRKHEITNWELYKSEKNEGWKHNFFKALQMSDGDIIFLCDQDDIWMPEKIEIMTKVLVDNKHIKLLAGNSLNFYSSGSKNCPPFYSFKNKSFNLDKIWQGKGLFYKINSRLKDKKSNLGTVSKVPFDEGLFSFQRQGCVMAFKRCIFNEVKHYWKPELPHDTMLWFYAAAVDGLYTLDKNVINYRHHNSNTGFKDTIGDGLTVNTESRKTQKLIEQINMLRPIIGSEKVDLKDDKYHTLDEIIRYNRTRLLFFEKMDLRYGLMILKKGKYVGKRQVIFDWLLTFFARGINNGNTL